MPLDIIVVGAGIGGLCAAVSLRQAGHSVKILEKSQFVGEVGAAVVITPNGTRVLSRLGFDFSRARADEMKCFEVVDGITLVPLHREDLSLAETEFGASLYTVHRADLHNELLHLGSDLIIKLGSRVVKADAVQGVVVLEDGSEHRADLIVAADGLHSTLRGTVLDDEDAARSVPSGMNAFRFMISTSLVQDDAQFCHLKQRKGNGNSVFADTIHHTERHVVWYTCRRGEVQNFAGIHDSSNIASEDKDLKTVMLREFGHYDPKLKHVMEMATDVTDWPLSFHDPLPTWSRGKVVLIGDAAHPMLPFGAQGANQAIEDAGALGALFSTGDELAAEVPGRIALFEHVRRLRASRIQTLSRVRLGKEEEVENEVRRYADRPDAKVPTSMSERLRHDYSFDVFAACKESLARMS